MKTDYRFSGDKDARRFVKTVEVSEETYQAVKEAIGGKVLGNCDSVTVITDTYRMFGGNCFSSIVSYAICRLVDEVAHVLDEKGMLSVDAEKASSIISKAVMPLMISIRDDEGTVGALSFFNDDAEEIEKAVVGCLVGEKGEVFSRMLRETAGNDVFPVGETALGILISIAGAGWNEDEKTN